MKSLFPLSNLDYIIHQHTNVCSHILTPANVLSFAFSEILWATQLTLLMHSSNQQKVSKFLNRQTWCSSFVLFSFFFFKSWRKPYSQTLLWITVEKVWLLMEILLNLSTISKHSGFKSTQRMLRYNCFSVCYLILEKYEECSGNSRRHGDSLKPSNLLRLAQYLISANI